MAPEVQRIHQQQLSKNVTFHYPFRNFDILTFSIVQGSNSHVSETLFLARFPETIVVCLVDAKAFVGNSNKSGFRFEPFELSHIAITLYTDVIIQRTIEFDIEDNNYWKGYADLCTIIGHEKCHGISPCSFVKDKFLLVFSLISHFGQSLHVERSGQLKLSLTFKKPLEKTLRLWFSLRPPQYYPLIKIRMYIWITQFSIMDSITLYKMLYCISLRKNAENM